MCKSDLHSFLKALPKCEHHIHLEGALTPSLLFSLAERNHVKLSQDDPAFHSKDELLSRYSRFTSLDDFLQYYYIGMSVLQHASDFEALAWDYFTHAHADGVHHTEVFFDPQAHTSRGIALSTVTEGFNNARSRAHRELGMSTELICCFLRHLPLFDHRALLSNVELQKQFADSSIIGVGLDSSELTFPPENFKEVFDEAGRLGLRRTAHAGEEGPASYIANAIDVLHVGRIDHGIRLAEDTKLMKAVVEEGLMLTVCPLSNVVLRCVSAVKDLPIRTFLDAGVRFSINSDDPAYFGGYILDNYCAVQEAFHLTKNDWARICRNGIEGSWCSQKRKDELMAVLVEVMKQA